MKTSGTASDGQSMENLEDLELDVDKKYELD